MAIYDGDSTDNTYEGTADADVIRGFGGNDTLSGKDGADTIEGGEGDDVLTGGNGADVLDGGPGFDRASYADQFAPVQVWLDAPANNTGPAAGDTFIGIEAVMLSTASDFGYGGAGDDIFYGLGLQDVLYGGAGNDYLDGGDYFDGLYGDEGNDTLIGGDWFDTLYGGPGADVMDGGTDFDYASYDLPGTLAVTVSMSDPTLGTGDAAGDTFISIEGLRLTNGDDVAYGTPGTQNVHGRGGNDTLHGLAGSDILYGEDGNDVLIGGGGADSHEGGSGFDTVSYVTSDSGVHVTTAGRNNTAGDSQQDGYFGVEAFVLSPHNDIGEGKDNVNDIFDGGAGSDALYGYGGQDALSGGDGADALYGGLGIDTLIGGAGDDLVRGGAGADVLEGGAGIDTLSYDDAPSRIVLSLDAPSLNTGDALGDNFVGFEAYRLSAFHDLAYGSNDGETFEGLGFRDDLYGQGGDDKLYGGDDHDRLWGGLGADHHDGGNGLDYVRYDDATFPGLTAALFAPSLNTGAAAGDTYANIEGLILGFFDDVGYGSNSADYIYGINGNDSLYGQGGDDYVHGGAGHDLLWGGLGADALDGDTGFDYARYDDATFAGLTASLLDASINTGAAAGDTFANIEGLILGFFDDTGHGNDADNYLYGINGNDTLYGLGGTDNLYGGVGNDQLDGGVDDDVLGGGDGDDVLIGGDGFDQLEGEGGNDLFRLDIAVAGSQRDRIVDFTQGQDQIQLERSVFTAFGADPLDASMLRSGAGFTTAADANDFLIYDTSSGVLYYDADGSGGGAAAVEIGSVGAPGLAVSDFMLL